jgi:hypothetical protein
LAETPPIQSLVESCSIDYRFAISNVLQSAVVGKSGQKTFDVQDRYQQQYDNGMG